MIIDDPGSHFIFIYHPRVLLGKKYTIYQGKELTNGEILQYWGKWIVLGDKAWLDELAAKLDKYVEDGVIPCIKYDRVPPANLALNECVMMVYCDKRQSEEIWQILSQHGVQFKAWVTERETMEMWLPGGQLLEFWIKSKNYDENMANAIREDARARLSYIFDHPDDIFQGWEQ